EAVHEGEVALQEHTSGGGLYQQRVVHLDVHGELEVGGAQAVAAAGGDARAAGARLELEDHPREGEGRGDLARIVQVLVLEDVAAFEVHVEGRVERVGRAQGQARFVAVADA